MTAAALAQVDWRGVLRELALEQPDLAESVRAAVLHRRILRPRHAAMAVLAAHGGRRALTVPTVERHGGDRPAGDWLHRTAYAALSLTSPPAAAVPVEPIASASPWLTVENDLDRLPLLDLAEAHAARRSRPVRIRRAQLQVVAGRHHRYGDVDLVELDPGLSGPDLTAVWLHEFGHVVDPHPAARSSHDGELYADEFARQLLSCLRSPATTPATLEHLDQVIRCADGATPAPGPPAPVQTSINAAAELPADGLPSLLAFAGLSLDR